MLKRAAPEGSEQPPLEIESLTQLERHIKDKLPFTNVAFQGLNLSNYSDPLATADLTGSAFLGCELPLEVLKNAHNRGALIFPAFSGLIYNPYRGSLYTAEELYEGFDRTKPETYANTPDARIYAHWKARGAEAAPSILDTLAQRLHDHAISDALEDLLQRAPSARKIVAIMGGHAMARGAADYRQVAMISRELTVRGFFMVSGGGPGAMEATHLGAWFATRTVEDLDAALAILALAPHFEHKEWLSRAFEVRERWPLDAAAAEKCMSLGVPTFQYGHEPPNPFATHIAKYFANSVREEGLLFIARGGVIYSPGSMGTFQEVFQDACQNHYLTAGVVSPMVFLGKEFWTQKKPVFPLLQQLAGSAPYAKYLLVTDSTEEVIESLVKYDIEQTKIRQGQPSSS